MEKEDTEDWEFQWARQNAMVEYYYGVSIGPRYPLLKKLNQLKHLEFMWETDQKINGVATK